MALGFQGVRAGSLDSVHAHAHSTVTPVIRAYTVYMNLNTVSHKSWPIYSFNYTQSQSANDVQTHACLHTHSGVLSAACPSPQMFPLRVISRIWTVF